MKSGIRKPGSNLEARVNSDGKQTALSELLRPLLLPLQPQYSFSSTQLYRQYLHETKMKSNNMFLARKEDTLLRTPIKNTKNWNFNA